VRGSALRGHIDYVDLTERVVQGVNVEWRDLAGRGEDSDPPSHHKSSAASRKRPRRK
jgi:hypothetical protein